MSTLKDVMAAKASGQVVGLETVVRAPEAGGTKIVRSPEVNVGVERRPSLA